MSSRGDSIASMTSMSSMRLCALDAVSHGSFQFPDEFIHGHVIKAAGASWHKECLKCETCQGDLNRGIWYIDGK